MRLQEILSNLSACEVNRRELIWQQKRVEEG
jgi:hypothetical protein